MRPRYLFTKLSILAAVSLSLAAERLPGQSVGSAYGGTGYAAAARWSGTFGTCTYAVYTRTFNAAEYMIAGR